MTHSDTLITTKATGPRSEAIYSFSQGEEGELLITAHNTCGFDGASRTFNVAKLFDPESDNPGLLTRGVLGLNAVEDICAIIRAVVTGPTSATMPSSGGDVTAAGGGSSAAAVAGGLTAIACLNQIRGDVAGIAHELGSMLENPIGGTRIGDTDARLLREWIERLNATGRIALNLQRATEGGAR